tara:strand:+ start:176 stop:1051 length:876 start_codon:yes stop_codon:yes gene_type:complete
VGFTWDTSGFGKTLKAKDLNDGFDAIENFVNEGIGSKEFKDPVDYTGDPSDPFTEEGFLGSSKIYRPEFYGSPSPRMMAISGQTHFRENPWAWDKSAVFNPNISGEGYISIPGCTSTIKLRHEAIVNIMTSFYCFEWGGTNKIYARKPITGGYENKSAGYVKLSVSGRKKSATTRQIFTSMVDPLKASWETGDPYAGFTAANGFLLHPMIGRHQHSITYQEKLKAGIHDVGLMFSASAQTGDNDWFRKEDNSEYYYGLEKTGTPEFPRNKYVFFQARNFIVDIYYLEDSLE